MEVFQDPINENPTVPVPAPDMEGLGELTNALGNTQPSKRQVVGAPSTTATSTTVLATEQHDQHQQQQHVAPAQATTPQPGQEAQLLSRWYQLVGEMQCLMSQMQSMGMQPPGFMPGAPASAATASPTTPQVPQQQQQQQQLPSQAQGVNPMMMPGSGLSVKVGHAANTAQNTNPVKQQQAPVGSQSPGWNPQQDPVVGGGNTSTLQQQVPSHYTHGHAGSTTPPAEDLLQGAALINANRRNNGNITAPRGQSGAVNTQSYNNEPAPYIALVEFKRQRIRRYEAMLFVKPGEYVVVDGDRGTDCGFVVQCAVRNGDGTYGHTESIDNQPVDPNRVKSEAGRIHRVATTAEVNNLHNEIASMERFALKTCRDRVADMSLNMEIVDCEFQFDRKKVTFFFDSQESIDFRDLTKDLYRLFGSRIWLENINTKVKNMVPEGALSHSDKMLYAQRGLRAPR